MARQFALAAALIAFSSAVAVASDDPWIGKKVFCKDDAKAKLDDSEIDIRSISFPVKVEEVDGEWLGLGRAWIRKDDVLLPEQALAYFTEQIRKNPSQAQMWIGRGEVSVDKGDFDGGIKDFTEAIRLDPKYAHISHAYLGRGLAWKNKGGLDNAVKDFSEAIRLDPKLVVAYSSRGNAFNERNELDKAINDFTEAIRLDPKLAWLYNNRGNASGKKGEFDKAIDDFTEAIRLDPKYAKAYSNRGKAWLKKEDLDNAIKDYTEAIRLDPKNAEPFNASAWLRATCPNERYRDGMEAVKNATTACELSAWKNGNNIDTLAAAYAEIADFANAIKWQEKAIGLTSDEKLKAELRTHLAVYKRGKPYREAPNK